MKSFQKMVQVDEQGIDLSLAKKLSKEALYRIKPPHEIYKRQAILNPKKMKKMLQLEDIVSIEPIPGFDTKKSKQEPCMALALIPEAEDRQIISIDSVQCLPGAPDLNSSFAKNTNEGMSKAVLNFKLNQMQSSNLL